MMVSEGRRIEAGVEPARTSPGERYVMTETTNIVRLRQPDMIDDPLTSVLRAGARQLLAQAIEIEAEAFLAQMRDLKLPDGRAWSDTAMDRNGPSKPGLARCP